MPEYLCECCNYKTPIKCKFEAHNQTSKHLNNMKSFVEPLKEGNPLQAKVDMLEELVKSLIKRIEVLENNPQDANRVVGVVEEVVEPVVEPFDLDIIINDLVQQNEISMDRYGYYNEFEQKEIIDWKKYMNDILTKKEQLKIAQGEIDEMLKETYKEGSIKSIYHKLRNVIPAESIKVKDISRSKYSIYCEGKWLNNSRSEEKLAELIDLYQHRIANLHHAYMTCMELHNIDLKGDVFEVYIKNLFEGREVIGKVIKLVLAHYNEATKD